MDKVKLLDHTDAQTMGCLPNVLCQIGPNTMLANFLLFDVPINKDVPLFIGRSFLYTLGTIMDMRHSRISVFGGQYKIIPIRKKKEESDSDDDEDEYSPKRDENGKPFYGPEYPSYLECEAALDRALGEKDYLNLFRDVCV